MMIPSRQHHSVFLIASLLTLVPALCESSATDECACNTTSCSVAAADVMVAIDQSVGMALEQWWLPIFTQALHNDLLGKGIGTSASCPNRFALWSFGLNETCATAFLNGTFMTMDQWTKALPSAARLPKNSADCQDAYQALFSALSSERRSKTNSCVRPILLLVTDERRSFCGCSHFVDKKAILRNYLKPSAIKYAAVVNVTLNTDDQEMSSLLGMSRSRAFLPVLESHERFREARFLKIAAGYELMEKNFVRMAMKREVDGSVWDIKQLRSTHIWHLSHALRKELLHRIPECELPHVARKLTPVRQITTEQASTMPQQAIVTNDYSDGCLLPNGRRVREERPVTFHSRRSPSKDNPTGSVCVIVALSESPGNGIANGYRWLPSSNITMRLDRIFQRKNYTHTLYCLITSGGQRSGRTVSVGAADRRMCGSASELSRAVSALQMTGELYDVAAAVAAQLSAGQTCAGRLGYVTVIIAIAPRDIKQPNVTDNIHLLHSLAAHSASMLLFGNFNLDSNLAYDWVLAMEDGGTGFEAIPGTRNYKLVNEAMSDTKGDLAYYENAALRSGGAVFDASWIGDEDYQPILERIFESVVSRTTQNLLSSVCKRCRCAKNSLECSSPLHVVEQQSCEEVL